MAANHPNGNRGATAVIVAIVIAMLFGFGALAVDGGHLYLSRTELQNAADACALRGAGVLYYNMTTNAYVATPQPTTNQQGYDAGIANQAAKTAVEISWTSGGNIGTDVERGHWSMGRGTRARGFTPRDVLTSTDLWNVSNADLDDNIDFINAVRCLTRREATPVTNFLAPVLGVFGGTGLAASIVRAEAVAYIGFAGKLEPQEVDQPIGICKDFIVDLGNDTFRCSVGRMINSSDSSPATETGMWTNFSQGAGCGDPSSNSSIVGLIEPTRNVCSGTNPNEISYGVGISTNNGELQSAFSSLIDVCWKQVPGIDTDGVNGPDLPWKLTLPVLDCQNSTCNDAVGAVTIEVLWITGAGEDPHFNDIPRKMVDAEEGLSYNCPIVAGETDEQRAACWNNFASAFQLRNSSDQLLTSADYMKKTIYFKPDCAKQAPTGHTGGENYGILSKYPALVR